MNTAHGGVLGMKRRPAKSKYVDVLNPNASAAADAPTFTLPTAPVVPLLGSEPKIMQVRFLKLIRIAVCSNYRSPEIRGMAGKTY
jgi:hypothetical protein